MPPKVNMQIQMIEGINRLKVLKKLKCDAKKYQHKKIRVVSNGRHDESVFYDVIVICSSGLL